MPALVVKATWGAERPEALLQAFTVAATGVASGMEVSVWLTGDATLVAVPGTPDVELDQSPPLSRLRDAVLDGGALTVCSQCAARRGLTVADLLPGTRIAGAAAFLAEATAPDTTALVY